MNEEHLRLILYSVVILTKRVYSSWPKCQIFSPVYFISLYSFSNFFIFRGQPCLSFYNQTCNKKKTSRKNLCGTFLHHSSLSLSSFHHNQSMLVVFCPSCHVDTIVYQVIYLLTRVTIQRYVFCTLSCMLVYQ